MGATRLNDEGKELVKRYLTRRGLLTAAGTLSAGMLLGFEFRKTPEIEAQQLTGDSLYDQLGGLVGISTVMVEFINIVAADNRINGFFADTVAKGRVPRLRELLIQQVAEASGGPVKYTGLDMKTAHAGMGITMDAFNALVEDLVLAMQKVQVPQKTQEALLGALAPMAADIVTA
jgi:hemoglobin